MGAKKEAIRLRQYSLWMKRRKWIDVLYQQYIYPNTEMSSSITNSDIIINNNRMDNNHTNKECSYPLPGIIAGQPISIIKQQNNDGDEDTISIFMNSKNDHEETITTKALTKKKQRQNNRTTKTANAKHLSSSSKEEEEEKNNNNKSNNPNRIIEC